MKWTIYLLAWSLALEKRLSQSAQRGMAIRALAADGKLAERGVTRESRIAFSEDEICALSDDTRWGSIR